MSNHSNTESVILGSISLKALEYVDLKKVLKRKRLNPPVTWGPRGMQFHVALHHTVIVLQVAISALGAFARDPARR